MTSYSTYSDHELVQLLRKGDSTAFTELYERYWEQMVTLALVKLGNAAEARDVVQEIFFDCWQRRQNLNPDHFEKWLAGAVKYKVLTVLAAAHRRNQQYASIDHATADHSTEQYLSYAELKARIEASVSSLPDKCRLVYKLSREQHMSLPEIAQTLQISQKTAEAHLTKALKHLRTSLKFFSCFV